MKNELKIKNYMDLDIWKISHKFVLGIYNITKNFPVEEIYGLTSQLRRAAYSIPANIAEGNGKQYIKGYIHSLYISKSSQNTHSAPHLEKISIFEIKFLQFNFE